MTGIIIIIIIIGVDIVLEYVPGGSIRSNLNKFGKFEERITSIYT